MIGKATLEDIKPIMEISRQVNWENVSDKNSGFLMSGFPADFYEKILEDPNYYLYVCDSDKKVSGFLIAYSSKALDGENELGKYFLEKFPNEEFVYIFQVGVDLEYQRMGIGSDLYKSLFRESKARKFKVISSKEPFNKASRQFHQKMGFTDCGIFKWKDGKESYVYSLDL